MKKFLKKCLNVLWIIIKTVFKFIKQMFVLTALCYTSPDKYDSERLLEQVEK